MGFLYFIAPREKNTNKTFQKTNRNKKCASSSDPSSPSWPASSSSLPFSPPPPVANSKVKNANSASASLPPSSPKQTLSSPMARSTNSPSTTTLESGYSSSHFHLHSLSCARP